MFNGLVTFTLNPQSGATYTVANSDLYQVLVQATNASTKTITIAPDSTLTSAATGSTITFLNSGAGLLTFAAGAGVTITSAGAVSAAPTLAQHCTAVAIRTGANAYTIAGAIG
jgi:predicted dinucleotide-utilizing enzyme